MPIIVIYKDEGSASIAAKEYFAYVTVLATMEPSRLRRRLADEYPLIYLLDPQRFGVRAYRHYLQPGHGREFLQAIVQGKAIQDTGD